LSPLIEEYLNFCRVEKGLAANSLAAYRRDLERAGGELAKAGAGDLTAAGPETLAAHLRSLTRRGLAPRSVRRALAALRGFYAHLVTVGERADDPAAPLEAPRLGRRLPKVLSESEVESLLAAPDVATPRGLRDRAMIELLYATGLRVSELVGLTLAQLQRDPRGGLDGGFVVVRGKGDKQRVVPVGEDAEGWLGRYLREVRPELARGRHQGVFVNRLGDPLTRQGAVTC
jgi:integrase/recombinase XerD